ncbi:MULTISPECIES: hypothetical protein [Bacteroidales]|uniref:hypothetical protein n=1 Tax=Bacteroidales TaxID=171549 RepID=UPI0025A50EA9|nr:hypothetical protein [Bacteroides acidifaciens]
MKKIMFSEKFGLTKAVLSGRKTQTRRIITCPKEFKGEWVAGFYVYKRESDGAIINWPCMYDADEATFDGGEILPKYKLGEVVAVAQSYKDAGFHPDTQMEQEIRGSKTKGVLHCPIRYVGGWNNKLFVAPNMMPHRIRITDVRVERLQDISDEDCMAEGVCKWTKDRELSKYDMADGFEMFEWRDMPRTPREAYAALIDRISGKGTWQSNPYVFVYEFELIK